ncbi:S24 family peptidase [Vreelandella aquamarina]|uniref:Peptidase S24/S26A/S26B/S26C domain-containing protein n=1 Tax=Vreelandella aquamarina TaxID=77097 RepID=A0A6F8SUN3_9GAMM|nr:helix-turn-helix transcriptional regulator [Halomonas meridiana]BCA91918.1 hypothetical protein HMSLTHF_16930 [Halomonas meridiana]
MHIYHPAKYCEYLVMDAYQIRKENLLKLMRTRTKAACADKWDTSASTLSQITSKKSVRNLGDALARKIERAEGLPTGWLDRTHAETEIFSHNLGVSFNSKAKVTNDLELHETEIIDEEAPLREGEVELPCFREVEFSAGDGRTQVVENGGHTMRFPLSKLAKRGVSPEFAACATASGSSMEPTIADGSPIAIDKGTRHIIDGKIYALDHGGMLRIKRLYKLPLGRVRLVSDNSDEYPEETHSLMGPDAPKIIGRVFWWEVFD